MRCALDDWGVAALIDREADRRNRDSVHEQGERDIPSAGERTRNFHVVLVEAGELALCAGISHRGRDIGRSCRYCSRGGIEARTV